MRQHAVVALSLIWVGGLVLISRGWIGDVRDYVFKVTGKPAAARKTDVPGLLPGTVDADEKAVITKFVIGYAVLWLVLTAGTESAATADVAAALAIAIALSASYLYIGDAAANLGVGG